MQVGEYLRYDMTGLAELVARREVSPAELLEAAINRLEAVNPRINAVVTDLRDDARRAAAGSLEGPLAGVPYLIKQHGALVAGTPTTLGSAIFQTVQPADSAIVASLRRAGLVIFGKTNLPELSNDAVTESALYGPARNPWNLEHTPGGSSGGSAAAVAAGIVPGAHGSDGGGSIRIPAACTGLFGFKPSKGRVSYAPVNEASGGFVVQHAVTRTVRDSALLLDIESRPQPGDPYWLPMPEQPFVEEARRAPGPLRIAFNTGGVAAPGVDDECRQAVLDAAALCESLGHHVEEQALPDDYPGPDSGLVTAASIAAGLDAEADRRGRPIASDEMDALSWRVYQRGRGATAADYVRALQACHAYGRRVAAFFQRYDILLNATTGSPPVRIGALRDEPFDIDAYVRRLLAFMPNTKAANITGQPAMSVPLSWSAAGLPIGVQFTARVSEDALLFRLAGQLEQARPWAHLRPPEFS